MKKVLELLIASASLCYAAIIPSPVVSGLVAPLNATITDGIRNFNLSQIPNPLRAEHIVTWPMISHDAFMRIEFDDNEPLLENLCHNLLTLALSAARRSVQEQGDETLLAQNYLARQGNLYLAVVRDPHSPTVTFTYGILLEAIIMLKSFLSVYRFGTYAMLMEGKDGRGPPIGEIAVWVRSPN